MNDAYRDGSGMLRAQIEEERAAIKELDARIGDVGRELVAKGTLEEIAALRRNAFRYFKTADDAREVLEQSQALRERLEEALVEKRACFHVVEIGFPELPTNHYKGWDVAESVKAAFEGELPEQSLLAWGRYGATTSFMESGVAIAVAIEPNGSWHQGWVGVRMPATLPRLEVTPEGLGDVVGQWLGIVKDIEVEDEKFDDLFRLRGSKAVARLLLTTHVRAWLAELHSYRGGLTITNGTAAYAWEAPAGRFRIHAAISLLVELREALAAAAAKL